MQFFSNLFQLNKYDHFPRDSFTCANRLTLRKLSVFHPVRGDDNSMSFAEYYK